MPDSRPFRHLTLRGAVSRWRLAFWFFFALLASTALARAQSAPQAAAGATVETAIILPGVKDEFHGVTAEHAYVAAHYPTWHIENQALIQHDGRRYDLLGMREPDGTKTAIYFDITDWFGK